MKPSRRQVLRGGAVALTLPFLESLEPREAHGQLAMPRRRFVAVTFPNGVANAYWKPHGVGAGNAWTLSPIQEPLTPLKSHVTVLNNVGNYGPFNGHIEPSHANLMAAFLTCKKAQLSLPAGVATTGISVDQVIANGLGGATKIPSLQLGLSTLDSYTDGLPGPCSRNISWDASGNPLTKVIDPQAVFDRLVAAGPMTGPVLPPPDPDATTRKNQSILDYVLGHATSVQTKLGKSDRARMDQFLTSVREIEKNLQESAYAPSCTVPMRSQDSYAVGNVPADYNRDTHANQMIDLIVMALQCDLTRVVTFMMDDARSDFVYNFIDIRQFTANGSTPTTAPDAGAHGISSTSDSNDGYATLNYWFVDKLSRLCQKLQAIDEGGTGTVLDKSVVWFGSEMHGGNHDGLDLPVLYVGSGGGRLKVDQNLDFGSRPSGIGERLANVYLSFIRGVFDLPVASFGDGTNVVPELLTSG